jgi:glycosyltransferase involved in cell wall biosynthesis
MKIISIITPTFNEIDNIDELYKRICSSIENNNKYKFEIVIIDNKSEDGTYEKLKSIAILDKRVKLIRNIKNYGHIRSPYWGIMQGKGDACIYLASDLQDAPEYIPKFIELWEAGHPIVMATKKESEIGFINKLMREIFYDFIQKISNHNTVKNATGFGIYDRKVIEIIREINDPEPYFRGLVAEIGFDILEYPTIQNKRLYGKTKNKIYTLIDYAILAVVNHSTIPIRLITIIGFFTCLVTILFGAYYLINKAILGNNYILGVSPLLVPIFLLFGLQFIFIGIIGEYLRILLLRAKNRPIVVEQERVNFE